MNFPYHRSGLPQPALALKEALVEGWSALSVDNILHVAGLSPFGVAVLYIQVREMAGSAMVSRWIGLCFAGCS